MSFVGQSFLSVENLNSQQLKLLFDRAKLFKSEFAKRRSIDHLIKNRPKSPKLLAMVFLEPSTRTRISFQTAAYRLGLESFVFDSATTTSLSKGETQSDTLKNIAAMLPDLLILRYGNSAEVETTIPHLNCPVINAGSGITEHPTQALLDAFTIQEALGNLKGKKVLIVGDVAHSRVANSNLRLLSHLGAKVAACGPEYMLPKTEAWKRINHFADLNEAAGWCDVLMGLRVQTERHGEKSEAFVLAEYRDKYQVTEQHLKIMGPGGLLMHPGPVIHGVEFSPEVLRSRQCLVLTQVTNGVFVRAALYTLMLGLEVESN
ncbi:MAG: aspartate carbamoyltransferase catalytic subunit [Bdellovibrionales bacterium]|nr:aspartate carbamoyltransferase catalytic subunit [Bdellovibrionales bacterium]